MIPSWQFSADPGVNIKLNDHVQFPPGWNQRTVQPVGPAYVSARVAKPQLAGVFDSWAFQNRKWIILGGIGLIAAAGLGLTAAVLK